MAHLVDSDMSEEQRQEAFKKAYLAELERYNEQNNDSEEVQVQVDKQGWDAEMNDDVAEDDDLEDVEWEWCDHNEHGFIDAEVSVNGKRKKLGSIGDDDLQGMTDDEFLVGEKCCVDVRVRFN